MELEEASVGARRGRRSGRAPVSGGKYLPQSARDLFALPLAGIYLLRDGRFIAVNPRFAEIVAYSTEDLTGKPLAALAWDGRSRRECARLQRGRDSRDPKPRTLSFRRRNGDRVHVEVASRKTRHRGRSAVIGTALDVSERVAAARALRAARDAAEEASRGKSVFLANMSHELRTPLNAIIGFSEIMEKAIFGPLGSARYTEYVHDIHESGLHLLALINDILEFAKLESGEMRMRETPIRIVRLAEDCLRGLSVVAKEAGVTLDLDLETCLPDFLSDEHRIRQILLNLLFNAIKFTPAGGRVVLGVCRRDRELVLSVRDTGIGMKNEDIETAFTAFRQVDSFLSRRHEGSGLGLPLSKGLCELLGGRLEIETRSGQGTCATAILPLRAVPSGTGVTVANASAPIPVPTASSENAERCRLPHPVRRP
ncbi:MAG: ATP-binding protein [Alphaproteobacteria bacterium]